MSKLIVQNKGDYAFFQGDAPLRFKRKGNEYTAEVQEDENGEIRFTVLRRSELRAPLWFLRCLLYWMLGFFGIFTKRYPAATDSVTCRVRIAAGHENEICMFMNAPMKQSYPGALPFTFTSTVPAFCDSQKFDPDPVAKRRRKVYTWIFNVLLRLVGLIGFAFVIVNFFIRHL